MILPMGKPILSCGNIPSKGKRHHCVSFCDDITVVEFECVKSSNGCVKNGTSFVKSTNSCVKPSLGVSKPPLCISRNLKNFLFLSQPVSKFFDRYQSRESEKRNILSIGKESRDSGKIKFQRQCSPPSASPEKLRKLLKLELFAQKPPKDSPDDFLSMTSKEKQWLASIQIHQLHEMHSSDFYFKTYLAKTQPGHTFPEPFEYLKEMKSPVTSTDWKKPSECSSPDLKSCLGKIPTFTVAHARQWLEDGLVRPPPVQTRMDPLLTIEYYYQLLYQIQDGENREVKASLVKQILRSEDLPYFMNVSKGQKLYCKLYSELEDRFLFWHTLFESLPLFFRLNKSTRPLNGFLILFRIWLMSNDNLAHVSLLGESIGDSLSFLLASNFGISLISLLVICCTNVKVILNSDEMYREKWAKFLSKLMTSLEDHPHVEMPLLGSRKHLIQFLRDIAPSQVNLNHVVLI